MLCRLCTLKNICGSSFRKNPLRCLLQKCVPHWMLQECCVSVSFLYWECVCIAGAVLSAVKWWWNLGDVFLRTHSPWYETRKKEKYISPKSLKLKVNFFKAVFSGWSSMTLGGVFDKYQDYFSIFVKSSRLLGCRDQRDDLTPILSASGKPFSVARSHTLSRTEKLPHFFFFCRFFFFSLCTPVCVLCFTRRAPAVLCSFTCSRAKRRRRQLMALTLDVLCRGARGSARCRLRRC